MAEGFDESEMKDFDTSKLESYTDDQLTDNYENLLLEMDKLLERGGNKGPVHVQMRYDNISRTLDAVEHERELRIEKLMAEADSRGGHGIEIVSDSFVDSDDGETVIINGVVETPAVKFAPSDDVEFGDIDSRLYNILDESEHGDIMTRLKNVKAKNKADINDQLERVLAVTKVIQKGYGINLDSKNIVAKAILNRTVIRMGKSGTDTLFFKRKLANGRLSKRPQLVLKSGKSKIIEYSLNKNSKIAVDQFKELINQYEESIGVPVEPEPPVEDYPLMDVQPDYANVEGLSPVENRELEGVLNPSDTILPESRIGDSGALQIQADNFQRVINGVTERMSGDETGFERIELQKRIDGLKEARDLTLEQRQLEETREIQEADISRLEKFKEWIKENWLGASALIITIASLLTTVIVGMRHAISKGASAVKSFGQSVYKIFKDIAEKLGPILGPVLSAIGSILTTILKYGAEGIAWLAKNLWALAIAMVYLIYSRYQKKKENMLTDMKDTIRSTFKSKSSDSGKKGTRRVVDVTFNPTEIASGQDLYIKLATLPINHVLIPGSRYLTFDFKNGNDESYHQPNLKSNLFKQITRKFNGEVYNDLNEANVLNCYSDLWFKSLRQGKIDQGLGGTTNLAKLRSGDASGDSSIANDATLNNAYSKRFKVPIDDDFLSENGAVYPHALSGSHETILKINSPGKLLLPGSNGKAVPASFKLENLKLRYETIENEQLASEIESGYNTGKSSYYSHISLVKTFPVSTVSTKIHENINIPRKSLRSVILLFKRTTDGSESYFYPNIQTVKVSFQGQPNYLYSQSMKKYDFYDEASRVFFPSDNPNDRNVSQTNFFTDNFGLVIDFSSTKIKETVGQGAKLTDSQNGVLLEITKTVSSAACTCYLYIISDGLLNINNGMLQSIQY